MRKWIILAVVLLIVAGGIVLALSNLNSYLNENRDWLAQQVEGAIGRRVQFDEVGVSLSGGLGASVTNLSIADDPTFSEGRFLHVGEAQILVKILPALRGKYEVRRVVLNAPEITIIQTASGFNFDSIGKKSTSTDKAGKQPSGPASEAPRSEPPRDEAPPVAAIPLLVGKISIEDGTVRFIDRTSKPATDMSIENLTLTASDLSPSTPMQIDFAAALLGARKPNLTVVGTVGPVGSVPDPAKINVALEVGVGPLIIDDLKKIKAIANALPPELSSPDPITLRAKVKGTVGQPSLNASFDGSDATIRYGDAFQKPKGVPFRLSVDAQRADTTIDVHKATLLLASLDVSAKGRVQTGTAASMDLVLNAKSSSLAGWDQLLPALDGIDLEGAVDADLHATGNVGGGKLPAIEGTVALRDVRASGTNVPIEVDGLTTNLTLKGDSLELPLTKLNVAGLPVELQASASNFAHPTAKVSLRAAELKLAALGFGGDGVKKEETLRDLTFDGSVTPESNGANIQAALKSSGGSLRNLDYQNLDVEVATRDSVTSLRQLSFNAYGGTFRGRAEYDMRKSDHPSFEVRSDVRDMDLALLLASQASKAADKLRGKLQTDITLSGSGKQWPAIRQSMRGNGKLAVRDGALQDINIVDSALTGVTGIAGLSNFISPRVRKKYPQLFGTSDTPFDQLGGTFQISDGRATTDDLLLSARDYVVNGKGYFTFEQEVDFTATLVASENLTADIIADVKEARYLTGNSGRLEIPFRLEGTLPDARPKPDSGFIANALQRAIVDKGLDSLFKKGKKKVGEEPVPDTEPRKENPTEELIKKGLDSLFGQ
jgi:uncharacterized protein involved in outer membrane biogenesis